MCSYTTIKKLIQSSNLLQAFTTYGFFALLNSALPFFLMPILTHYLSPLDYGYVSLFNILLSLFTAIVGCNISGAYTRAYFSPDRFSADEYWITVFKLILIIGIIITLIVAVTRNFLQLIFKFPSTWLLCIPITAMAVSICSIVLTYFQVRMMARQYGIFMNTRTLVQTILCILLVTIVNLNWKGQIISISLGHIIFAFIGGYIVFYHMKYKSYDELTCKQKFNLMYAKHALAYGIPLIPHALSGILNATINRIFVSQMVGVPETGLFTVGYQIGSIILLLANSFNQAYTPWLFEQLNHSFLLIKQKIVKLTYVYFVVILISAIILSLMTPPFISLFIGKNFYGAYIHVIWIAIGFAFTGMYYMVVNFIFYVEKTRHLAKITMIVCIINIIFNYLLIKINGAVGAAQATTLTSIVYFVIVWRVSAKVYPMPWLLYDKNSV